MAFLLNDQLQLDPVEHFRCQQHAARVFVDDQFRLAPKHKFLFHVAFNINWTALKNNKNVSLNLLKTLKDEVNLLVKSASIPSYSVSHEVLNQYNRKKVVQYQHKYNDIDIAFHDDNMGLINQLWQAYYKYYYADPSVASAKGAYNKTAMLSSSHITSPYGYNGRIAPFFNYITIYQMARHEYVSYKLINPVITSWTGNKVAYSENTSHNFDMKIAYEAVSYNVGLVESGEMEGFGAVHYDYTPSPLSGLVSNIASTSPTFSRTPFGSTDNKVITDNKIISSTVPVTDPTAYQSVLSTGSSNSGLQTVAIPQKISKATVTTATQATLPSTAATATTNATVPDYATNL
jgi:hypothetical protein